MRLLNCPKQEKLFELVSIPTELSWKDRNQLKFHTRFCSPCREKAALMTKKWESLFSPEPDITSSLLNVYSRLQKDETLILKGWKLGDGRARAVAQRSSRHARAMIVTGGGAVAFLSLLVVMFVPRPDEDRGKEVMPMSAPFPYAQIRTEDKNRIKVRYVRPELLNSMEFETTNSSAP